MKKVVIILAVLFLLPLLSSAKIEMNSQFSQGETLTAKVPGLLLNTITSDDITFYRGHVKIPVTSYVTQINNDFYIYAQLLGRTEGNYSIEISEVKSQKGIEVVTEDLVQNFTIENQTADFYVDKGFVSAKGDFTLEIQDLSEDPIEVQITSTLTFDTTETITLKSGEKKKINFNVDSLTPRGLQTISLSSANTIYEIPVYIFVESATKEKKFKFDPSTISMTALANYSNATRRIVLLRNTGDIDLENISVYVSSPLKQYVSLSSVFVDLLKQDESMQIDVYLISSNITDEKTLQGQLTAKQVDDAGIEYAYASLDINISKDYIPLTTDTVDTNSLLFTCAEKSGAFCTETQTCEGQITSATDGNCCIGTCKETETSSGISIGKIIGWSIVIVVALFLIWFFAKKYKGTKKSVNLLDVAKGKR